MGKEKEKDNQSSKKVDKATDTINVIMRNRLIIALLLIADGINFIVNPANSIDEMARSIIMIVFFATLAIFITNLTSKEKDKKSIIVSFIVLILCVVFYFMPDLISTYIRLILALFIIYNGLSNLLEATKYKAVLDKAKDKVVAMANKQKGNKDVEKNLNEQADKIIGTLNRSMNKTSTNTYVYMAFNILTVILGFLLLLSDVTVVIWGIIFIYVGLSDLIVAAKSMNIRQKLKNKEFKSIVFDSDNKETKEK